jgi:hypothetical protein
VESVLRSAREPDRNGPATKRSRRHCNKSSQAPPTVKQTSGAHARHTHVGRAAGVPGATEESVGRERLEPAVVLRALRHALSAGDRAYGARRRAGVDEMPFSTRCSSGASSRSTSACAIRTTRHCSRYPTGCTAPCASTPRTFVRARLTFDGRSELILRFVARVIGRGEACGYFLHGRACLEGQSWRSSGSPTAP